jgi:kynureninase
MFENDISYAREMDRKDPLREYRDQFHIPKKNGKDLIYFTGNSLGLQPKKTREYVEIELKDWEDLGVEGHFESRNPWFGYHKMFEGPVARLVGAKPHEVAIFNTLTTNLHLMMVSFYRPEGKRNKILVEGTAFPSDQYAIESQIRFHGLKPDDCIIELIPREGEYTIRTEDILRVIDDNRHELALVLLGGVNYYTGQAFEMDLITKAGHGAGAMVGFDLAHAAGNLVLDLHNWDVDFAVWCSYKYLNSGPGGVAGIYVHERWSDRYDIPRFAGWWGHHEASRFQMKKGFIPMAGAAAWQLSNAQVLPMAAHKASLDIFDRATMPVLRAKSELLTGYLEYLIIEGMKNGGATFKVITPSDPKQRGAQLSMLTDENGRELFKKLTANNIIADWREPNVIRVAPVPLYNTFEDVYRFSEVLFG